jgi:hypothetical protein
MVDWPEGISFRISRGDCLCSAEFVSGVGPAQVLSQWLVLRTCYPCFELLDAATCSTAEASRAERLYTWHGCIRVIKASSLSSAVEISEISKLLMTNYMSFKAV